MSITIGITNDTDQSIRKEYECMCIDADGHGAPDCYECKGLGKLVFEDSKYERNLANGNFSTLWNALGLTANYSGEINPRDLLIAVNSMNPDLGVRAPKKDGIIYTCGLPRHLIESYLDSLRLICLRAIKMGEKVCWA